MTRRRGDARAPLLKSILDGIDETRLKQRAFDIYKRGGERAAIAAEIAKLGITQSTLATWLYFFGLMVKFGRQTR